MNMTETYQPEAEDHAAQDQARADFYGLLARLFYAAPDAALLGLLANADPLTVPDAQAQLPAAWDALIRAAQTASFEHVSQEYDDTFIGVGRPPVLLYGSYYLAGALNEKPLAKLRGDLGLLGLARRDGVAEPEDHIAALSEVMRQVIVDPERASRSRDESARQFFVQHIEPWYARLCDAIDSANSADFYRSVACFTRAFFDLEREFFRMA